MPAGMLPVSMGWKPPVIGAKAGGGWLNPGGTADPEENGRRAAAPGIDGAGPIGPVRGKTEADHRCCWSRGTRPPITEEAASSSARRSVTGRISREDVARCIGFRRDCAAA